MKKCPYCAEEIQDEAIKCKFCGEFLDKKKSSVLDITKGFLNQTGVFLKDLKQKHEENKYKHLCKLFQIYLILLFFLKITDIINLNLFL